MNMSIAHQAPQGNQDCEFDLDPTFDYPLNYDQGVTQDNSPSSSPLATRGFPITPEMLSSDSAAPAYFGLPINSLNQDLQLSYVGRNQQNMIPSTTSFEYSLPIIPSSSSQPNVLGIYQGGLANQLPLPQDFSGLLTSSAYPLPPQYHSWPHQPPLTPPFDRNPYTQSSEVVLGSQNLQGTNTVVNINGLPYLQRLTPIDPALLDLNHLEENQQITSSTMSVYPDDAPQNNQATISSSLALDPQAPLTVTNTEGKSTHLPSRSPQSQRRKVSQPRETTSTITSQTRPPVNPSTQNTETTPSSSSSASYLDLCARRGRRHLSWQPNQRHFRELNYTHPHRPRGISNYKKPVPVDVYDSKDDKTVSQYKSIKSAAEGMIGRSNREVRGEISQCLADGSLFYDRWWIRPGTKVAKGTID